MSMGIMLGNLTNYDIDIWDNEEQGPVCYWMSLPEQPKEET